MKAGELMTINAITCGPDANLATDALSPQDVIDTLREICGRRELDRLAVA